MVLKKVNWKKTFLASIFLGYLGVDSFILKNFKRGIEKIFALILSLFIFINFEKVLEYIIKISSYTLYFLKSGMSHLGNSKFLTLHIPRLITLAVLTILVIFILMCAISILILWIGDIIAIARKDKFENIDWKN
jgi:hypothetical protein